MSVANQPNIESIELEGLCEKIATAAKIASKKLPLVSSAAKTDYLHHVATELMTSSERIILANQRDLDNAQLYGLTNAEIDRLRLDKKRIFDIAGALIEVANLPDPIGETIETFQRPIGITISKVRVPLGVVFFIYESRPNVTADAAAICLKSGNAVILRGGKEALYSSREIVSIMQEHLEAFGLPAEAIQLVPVTSREAVGKFLAMSDRIDVAIPRGGKGLIERVMSEAKMPVIKHYDGVCHVYVDASADLNMALNIIENSKCQRMGVCNAMESLLVHEDVAAELLPQLRTRLEKYKIEYRSDEAARKLITEASLATEADWGTEYLGPTMSLKIVADIDEAMERIEKYGSHHSDCIISNNYQNIERFVATIDSAAVMVNASTRFNDGGQFGFGAEIGISTDKFHARGPCGLRELTSYKYIVRGNGQIRE